MSNLPNYLSLYQAMQQAQPGDTIRLAYFSRQGYQSEGTYIHIANNGDVKCGLITETDIESKQWYIARKETGNE